VPVTANNVTRLGKKSVISVENVGAGGIVSALLRTLTRGSCHHRWASETISETIGTGPPETASVCGPRSTIGLHRGPTALHEGVFTVGLLLCHHFHQGFLARPMASIGKGIAAEQRRSGHTLARCCAPQQPPHEQSVRMQRGHHRQKPALAGKRPQLQR